jgi:hypothetical protein
LNSKIIFICAVGLLFYAGCSKSKESDIYLAEVEGEKLTFKDIASRFDTTSMKSKKKLQDYVNHWINTSVLYKEADNSDIVDSDEYKELLNEAKKEIAVNLLLKKEVYEKKIDIAYSEIQNYYYQHRNEFFLGSDVVNISYATFINEPSALGFRQSVIDGKSWSTAVTDYIKTHAQNLVVAHEDSTFFKQSELYPPDIWKSIVPLKLNELSKPLRVFDGFMVVKLNCYQKAGEIGSLEFAKSDIVERLTVERKRQIYMNYLKSLHEKYKSENYYNYSNK